MNIDYRELLMKYIAHVGECEGVTFIADWHFDRSKVALSKDERAALEGLDVESAKYDAAA